MFKENYKSTIISKYLYSSLITHILVLILLVFFSIQNNTPIDILIFLCGSVIGVFYYLNLLVNFYSIYPNKLNLFFFSFLVCVISISLYNTLFYVNHGSFLAFLAKDTKNYHEIGLLFSREGYNAFFQKWYINYGYDIDDWGFPIYVGIVYSFISSHLFLNIVSVSINLLNTLCIFKIGNFFLNLKNAYMAALTYGTASYSLFYIAAGHKEVLMVFFILNSCFHFLRFLKFKKISFLVLSLLFCCFLVFFRLPLLFIVLLSFSVTQFFAVKRNKHKKLIFFMLILFVSVFIIIKFWPLLSVYFRRSYLYWLSLSAKESGCSLGFTFLVSLFCAFSGPLPTLLPLEGSGGFYFNLFLTYPSSVLIVLLSPLFWYGVKSVISEKNVYVLPLMLYTVIEIAALFAYSITFDLRRSVLHFPFIILIAFFACEVLKRNQSTVLILIYFISILLAICIFFWNYLRLF